MTPAAVAFAAAGLSSAIYLALYCYAEASPAKSFFKTAAVALIGLAVFWTGGAVPLLLAIGLCALGDFLLSLDRERAFLAGVAAFAAGHVMFVVVMLAHGASDPGRLAEPGRLLVIGALLMVGVVMVRLLWHRAGALRGAVVAYVPVILSMGLAALTLPVEGYNGLVLLGAASFVVSDIVLASEMFLLAPATRLRRIVPFIIWATYWFAMVNLGLGLSWIR